MKAEAFATTALRAATTSGTSDLTALRMEDASVSESADEPLASVVPCLMESSRELSALMRPAASAMVLKLFTVVVNPLTSVSMVAMSERMVCALRAMSVDEVQAAVARATRIVDDFIFLLCVFLSSKILVKLVGRLLRRVKRSGK